MAAILSAEHIKKSYTLKKLITDATMYIGEKDRIGVVGVNGTGKSTALHVIAEKACLEREAPYNRTGFFDDYVGMCRMELRNSIPQGSCIITSDDVFDHMIAIRELNDGIDHRRTEVFEEYLENRRAKFQLSSMEDYDQLKRIVRARKKSQSGYVKEELGMNVRTFSNGESAFRYFTNKITEDRLYLLDEPEPKGIRIT